jgi:hypothetical protein
MAMRWLLMLAWMIARGGHPRTMALGFAGLCLLGLFLVTR